MSIKWISFKCKCCIIWHIKNTHLIEWFFCKNFFFFLSTLQNSTYKENVNKKTITTCIGIVKIFNDFIFDWISFISNPVVQSIEGSYDMTLLSWYSYVITFKCYQSHQEHIKKIVYTYFTYVTLCNKTYI